MSYDRPATTMVVALIVGLVIGAGVGYFIAPTPSGPGSSSAYNQGYDDGYDDGYADGSDRNPTQPTDVADAISGLTTLIYGAIGASLITALASIVTLMQTSRYPR